MQQVSFTGKSGHVNFDLNVAYSSHHYSNQRHHQNYPEEGSGSNRGLMKSGSFSPLTKESPPQEVEGKKKTMPNQRRKVRNVEQRRKMKLHNRKDDIPDCDTLEIIDFDESFIDPICLEPYPSDSDSSRGSGSCKSQRSVKKQQRCAHSEPEADVSFISEGNERSFQSCPGSDGDGGSGVTTSTSHARSTTAGTTASTTSRRRGKKHRRREPPSALMNFFQSLLENFGQAFTDFFMYLCSVIKFNGTNGAATPTGCILLLVGAYFFVSYIEVSFAGLVEILFEWLWPSIHVSLRMIERFFKGIGNIFAGLDDIAESSYCDMASMWCDFFNLMCSSRCSFTKFALERLRR